MTSVFVPGDAGSVDESKLVLAVPFADWQTTLPQEETECLCSELQC